MNFARALVRDLVDKRLWPIAALLAAALISVPLLLGGGGSADKHAAVPAAAVEGTSSASQAAPAVELVGPPSVRSRRGRVRDPFRRPPKPKAVNADGSTSKSDGAASAGTSAKDSTSDSAVADPSPGATPTHRSPFAYRTTVRFGSTDGDAGKDRAISRLTPLGNRTQPALLYLGVSNRNKGATFVLGPKAQPTGEGICFSKNCRVIFLKAGMSTVVDLTLADGTPRQYSLEVVSVQRERLSTALARKARAREHPDGRDIMRELNRDDATKLSSRKIVYVQSLGVLVRKKAP
jgi:hypothetical protein